MKDPGDSNLSHREQKHQHHQHHHQHHHHHQQQQQPKKPMVDNRSLSRSPTDEELLELAKTLRKESDKACKSITEDREPKSQQKASQSSAEKKVTSGTKTSGNDSLPRGPTDEELLELAKTLRKESVNECKSKTEDREPKTQEKASQASPENIETSATKASTNASLPRSPTDEELLELAKALRKKTKTNGDQETKHHKQQQYARQQYPQRQQQQPISSHHYHHQQQQEQQQQQHQHNLKPRSESKLEMIEQREIAELIKISQREAELDAALLRRNVTEKRRLKRAMRKLKHESSQQKDPPTKHKSKKRKLSTRLANWRKAREEDDMKIRLELQRQKRHRQEQLELERQKRLRQEQLTIEREFTRRKQLYAQALRKLYSDCSSMQNRQQWTQPMAMQLQCQPQQSWGSQQQQQVQYNAINGQQQVHYNPMKQNGLSIEEMERTADEMERKALFIMKEKVSRALDAARESLQSEASEVEEECPPETPRKPKSTRSENYEIGKSVTLGVDYSEFDKTALVVEEEDGNDSPPPSIQQTSAKVDHAKHDSMKEFLEMVDKLKQYKIEKNTTHVSFDDPDNADLLRFVEYQRRAFGNGTMVDKRRTQPLNDVGFSWRSNWEGFFYRLVQFHTKFNTTQVPLRYDDDKQLLRWTMNQRKDYCHGTLSKEKIDRLKSIGFDWDPILSSHKGIQWFGMFNLLSKYKERGYNDVSPAMDIRLLQWLRRQQIGIRTGELQPYRYTRMYKLGFAYDSSHRTEDSSEWFRLYSECMRFMTKFQKRIPDYCPLDPAVGAWAYEQRTAMRMGTLGHDHIRMLNDIGFVWEVPTKTEKPICVVSAYSSAARPTSPIGIREVSGIHEIDDETHSIDVLENHDRTSPVRDTNDSEPPNNHNAMVSPISDDDRCKPTVPDIATRTVPDITASRSMDNRCKSKVVPDITASFGYHQRDRDHHLCNFVDMYNEEQKQGHCGRLSVYFDDDDDHDDLVI